jgi:hypothetical protein
MGADIPYIQKVLPLPQVRKRKNVEKFMLDVVTLMQKTSCTEIHICSPLDLS